MHRNRIAAQQRHLSASTVNPSRFQVSDLKLFTRRPSLHPLFSPLSTIPTTTLSFQARTHLSCRLRTPNCLQKSILLRQSVQTIVTFRSRPHKPAQCVHLILACVTAVLIDFANGNLDRGVVFCFNDTVRCAAFARDVAR